MSEQIIAYGATVERSVDGVTYTKIPECKGVAIPSTVQDYPEVTHLESPNGFREYIKGLKDAGEISIPCGYTADGYEQAVADEAAADAIYYRTTLRPQPAQTTGDRFVLRAFPTPSLEGGDVGAPIEMSIALRITGDVTYTRGTGRAPVLSSATGTQTGATTADVSVSTTIGAGTLYAGVFPTAATPTATEIKAGTGAAWSGSSTAPGVGVEEFEATGLTTATAYRAHFVQENGGTDSNIAVSSGFTTA